MTLVHTIAHPGGDGPHPTLIAFHGYGANAQDLISLAPLLMDGRMIFACPQGPTRIDPTFEGYSWYQPPGDPTPENVARAVEAGRAFIDRVIERYDADPERIALLGFSQGGGMAFRIGLAEPGRFRGIAALSTSLPPEVGAEQQLNEAQRSIPILIQHGIDDPTVTVERGREARTRLEALGNRPEYREYIGLGHGINARSAEHLSDWLARVLKRR